MLETIEELHILQPGSAIHISARTPERFLCAGCKVIRQGHGYPSVFNPDVYIQELMRQGKSLQDAREGGCSGCIEVGAFGKEAYVLTGYLNVPKISTTVSIRFPDVRSDWKRVIRAVSAIMTNYMPLL